MAVIRSWAGLSESERDRVLVAKAFLTNRFSERDTIDWALRLKPDRHAERFAINDLLSGRPVPTLKEPFATAWRLLEESWANPGTDKHPASAVNDVRRRLRDNERSGALVQEIANLVAPRLEVEPVEHPPWWPVSRPRRPKRFQDLLTARLTSISIHRDFGSRGENIGLAELDDMVFLTALASALISAVDRGIHIATRLHGDDEDLWGPAGMPIRVYFERVKDGPGNRDKEVDAYNRGIASSVKFLHAVVLRIAKLDIQAAMPFVWRWRKSESQVYRRLWAAVARDPRLASPKHVSDFLAALDNKQFWDLDSFPEVAMLRATRFADLDREAQAAIVRRLRIGPRRKYWRRDAEAERIKAYRRYLGAREFKRIEAAGGVFPARICSWLLDAAAEFPDLEDLAIRDRLLDPAVRRVTPPSAEGPVPFDELEGLARLRALESALSGGRHHREDSAAARARDWLQNSDHVLPIVSDLESSAESADQCPRVWDCFLWFYSPPPQYPESGPTRDGSLEANRVLRLIRELSDATFQAAMGGISHWLHAWSRHAVPSELGAGVWLRAWPIAVEATNTAQDDDDDDDRGLFPRPSASEEQLSDIDTLNAPAAKLVRAFLSAFSAVDEMHHVFVDGSVGKQMLDCVIRAPRHSALIARCLLMERIARLLRVNPEWAKRHLVRALSGNDRESILLWRAVAPRRIETHALKVIGDDLLRKVLDRRLGSQSREFLVRSVVFEVLEAFRDNREPAVPAARLSQMLRFADDEIWTCTAQAMKTFQEEVPDPVDKWRSARDLFASAVQPFLREVWPQERSLATAGVSGELASLPAMTGEAFAEAVEQIERFLTPFACWSLFEYGFHDDGEAPGPPVPQLSVVIDDVRKARALLRLLDLTIGATQTAVVPHDLSIALHRIETVAPKSVTDPAFRRLATAARR